MNACMRHCETLSPPFPHNSEYSVATRSFPAGPRAAIPVSQLSKKSIYQTHFESLSFSFSLSLSSALPSPTPNQPTAPRQELTCTHTLKAPATAVARRKRGSITRRPPFPLRASSSSPQHGILPSHPPLHHAPLHRGRRRHRQDRDAIFRSASARPGTHASR